MFVKQNLVFFRLNEIRIFFDSNLVRFFQNNFLVLNGNSAGAQKELFSDRTKLELLRYMNSQRHLISQPGLEIYWGFISLRV